MATEPKLPDKGLLFPFADDVIGTGALGLMSEGQRGAFWQVLVPRPEDITWNHEIQRENYCRRDARSFLYWRVKQGFEGLLGFCCLDVDTPRLYAEAFDTRTGLDIALSRPLRKTIFGRYQMVDARGELHGDVVPLHIDS